MNTKDITLLIGHPDDEVIFLWPFLSRVKRIVCASSDAHNPERVWCAKRGECLIEVAELLGADAVIHHNDSEFYRAPTRNGALHQIVSHLMRAVKNSLLTAPVLATHNAWGEYGNLDHLLCHHIARTVQAETECTLLVTDIAVTGHPAWLPITPWRQSGVSPGTSAGVNTRHIDPEMFDQIKSIYDAKGCWTWADQFGVVETCRVFSL